MATKRDYYDILGVPKTSSAAEIKSAYRKQAMQWHPDRNKAKDAEEKFKEINEAYQVLSDAKKKATYDQFGHAAPGGFEGFGGQQQQGPFTYSYSSGGGGDFGGFSDPFEIFEQFFGGSAGGFSGRRAPQKPHYSLHIPFMTAVKGGGEEVEINGKRHKIKIPAGTDTGTHLRFEHFDVTFEVAADSYYKRDGANIFVDHKISFALAAIGGETDVKTLEGNLKIKIRPGTQPGTMMRLTGRGLHKLNSFSKDEKGDLYIKLVIEVPTRISRRQKELLEEFGL